MPGNIGSLVLITKIKINTPTVTKTPFIVFVHSVC